MLQLRYALFVRVCSRKLALICAWIGSMSGRALAEISLAASRLWRDSIRDGSIFGEDLVCDK